MVCDLSLRMYKQYIRQVHPLIRHWGQLDRISPFACDALESYGARGGDASRSVRIL
jgi:hypothetical protein